MTASHGDGREGEGKRKACLEGEMVEKEEGLLGDGPEEGVVVLGCLLKEKGIIFPLPQSQ